MKTSERNVDYLESQFDRMKEGGKKIKKVARHTPFSCQGAIERRQQRRLKRALRYA